ncbi:MAG TPA: 2OG-Fe(II) oxygenase [Acidimicrobiales bacterium]|nr:2OG-Fe(II) oxygenase [Acidimicrobiales bacterium]
MRTSTMDTGRYPIEDPEFTSICRHSLEADGALVLEGFFVDRVIERIVDESARLEGEAFYADTTHNVYLTPTEPGLAEDHPFNRQVRSSKGLIADDQIPSSSLLRQVYDDLAFRMFLCGVLGIDDVHPYADELSSINIHFAPEGRELGWHFDNSSFAVTMLLQAPEGGGVFEFVAGVRDPNGERDGEFERVRRVLDDELQADTLQFAPGDLVVFRGRSALHRVTPTQGSVTRMLVVFAFNDQPGVGLSESALMTFYGRTS